MRGRDADDFSDPLEEAPLFAMGTEISFTRNEVETYYANTCSEAEAGAGR